MAGFRVLWANEFVPAAAKVYRANFPTTIVSSADIRRLSGADILKAIDRGPGDIDLLDGSPPCASFSTAGKRAKNWGKVKCYSETKQRTDDLFWEYARIVEDIKPKVFVAENVSGLVKGVAKGYFIRIIKRLRECGYRVACRVVNAKYLGVPQSRARTIFIGVRNDLGLDPVHPKPLKYQYSIRDAVPWITHVESNPYEGGDAFKMPPGQVNMPAPTVVTLPGSGSYVRHKVAEGAAALRKFSIVELKRLCAFPDDFALTGSYSQQWERLGRAVPPVMMCKIAETIRDEILGKL